MLKSLSRLNFLRITQAYTCIQYQERIIENALLTIYIIPQNIYSIKNYGVCAILCKCTIKFKCTNSSYLLIKYNFIGVMEAADKALFALNRIRAGIKADKRVANRQKRAKTEVSSLFRGPPNKKLKSDKKVAWRHKFVCLAYRDQERSPTTDSDKDELFQAGLGEREISFPSLDMNATDFKGVLLESFPKLKDGGGYQLLKGVPNSRTLEVLSLSVHTSPSLLKQRVGNSRTYIRPIQKDLDLSPIEDTIDAVCVHSG